MVNKFLQIIPELTIMVLFNLHVVFVSVSSPNTFIGAFNPKVPIFQSDISVKLH